MRIPPLRGLLVTLVVCIVLAPRVASAASLFVTFAFPTDYGDLEFGPSVGVARIVDQTLDETEGLWGPFGEVREIGGGTLNFWTGPLLDVIPTVDDADYLHAGGGGLSILFDLTLSDGSIHHGTFAAPVGPFTVRANAEGGGGYADGTMGAGLFDAATAHLLGIQRQTGEWGLEFYLDSYDSYPAPYRVAKSFGYVAVPVVVPEPATLWLLGMGLALGVRRMKLSH